MEFEQLKWDYYTKCMQTPKENSASAQKKGLKRGLCYRIIRDNLVIQ